MGRIIQTRMPMYKLPFKIAIRKFMEARNKVRKRLGIPESEDRRYAFREIPSVDMMEITEVCPECDTPLEECTRPGTGEKVKGCDRCEKYFKMYTPEESEKLRKTRLYKDVN